MQDFAKNAIAICKNYSLLKLEVTNQCRLFKIINRTILLKCKLIK